MKTALSAEQLEQGFRLGGWHVQPQGGVLRRPWPAGSRRRVEPKVMRVLLELAARPRDFVSKAELFAAIWGRRPSSDDRLTRAVHALRQALDDDPQQPRYIETRNNVGYRLIAPVRPARRVPPGLVAAVLAAVLLAGTIFMTRTERAEDAVMAAAAGLAEPARAQYLQARYWLARGDTESLRAAQDAFTELVAAEPVFAPAWLGRAQTGLELFKQGAADVEQLRQARVAAERAMALGGPTAAVAMCLGQVRLFLDWDLAGAAALYRDAIRMDPREPVARVRYAWLLVARGDYVAAAEEIEQVRLLDPLYYASADMAALMLYAGQVDAAIAEFERLERTTALRPAVLRIMGTAYWSRGDEAEARAAFLRMWEATQPLSGAERARLAAADSERLIRGILAQGVVRSPVAVAGFHALLGEQDEALAALEVAMADRVPQLLYVGAMPEFAMLRTEPRFRRLLAQLGLEAYAPRLAGDPHISPPGLGKSQGLLRNQEGSAGSD
ncbi:MAG TPA: winged helix-turn-helix domain-containing protein [Gammaproteobacteria bacterium]|nr:winged helix-turn-helix domain-containing protein [Gammaproteobacteria bacterium]